MNIDTIANQVCREVAELPDRNSPEDWPEAMLVTHDELRAIVRAALSTPTEGGELPDMLKLAQECGATVYRNRASPQQPAVAFGDESWAKFRAALSTPTPLKRAAAELVIKQQKGAKSRG